MTASVDKSYVELSPVVEEIDVGISVVSTFVRNSDVEGPSVIKSLVTTCVDAKVVDRVSVLDLDVDCLFVGLSVVKDVVTSSVEILSVDEAAVVGSSVVEPSSVFDWDVEGSSVIL